MANVPFITWPFQDEAAIAVIKAVENGEAINFEKSRDMGATWLLLTIADWYFLWHENVNVGCISRKQDLVDSGGDMDSLFEKIRYIHRLLPTWQLPAIWDRYMHLKNMENDSTIAGESTNVHVGRGGRKTWYLVDEAAAIPNAQDVESSLSQNTPCQIWASTPFGPNTVFHQRIKEGRGILIQMPWWRHPEKSQDAHQILDKLGKVKWTSPWYEKQCENYSAKTIAREIDMDHGQAGDMFFDYTEIERHRQDHETLPNHRGELRWLRPMPEQEQVEIIQQLDHSQMTFLNATKGSWRFWFHLKDGRPPQYWSYAFGIDISNGAGESNSIISVVAVEIGQIVAKFWDAYTSPEALAVIAAMAGVWFGGVTTPAFIAWENNGSGGTFGRKLVKMDYPMYYRQRHDDVSKKKKRTPRWGWNSNVRSKEILLGRYRDALGTDTLINPCKESLDEAIDYIYGPGGVPMPSVEREETSGGRALHGDHVVADALCVLARDEVPRARKNIAAAPRGSYLWRQRKNQRTNKKSFWDN